MASKQLFLLHIYWGKSLNSLIIELWSPLNGVGLMVQLLGPWQRRGSMAPEAYDLILGNRMGQRRLKGLDS